MKSVGLHLKTALDVTDENRSVPRVEPPTAHLPREARTGLFEVRHERCAVIRELIAYGCNTLWVPADRGIGATQGLNSPIRQATSRALCRAPSLGEPYGQAIDGAHRRLGPSDQIQALSVFDALWRWHFGHVEEARRAGTATVRHRTRKA